MTQIDITNDIPSQINTLERLALWTMMAMRRVNPTFSVIEVSDQPGEKVAQTAIIQADDGKVRFVGRVSIEMAADYAEDNEFKLWTKAEEISNTQLPEDYKQN